MRHQFMNEHRSDFMKRPRVLVTVILASSLISGCMVGPKYHRPVVQTPTVYRDLSVNPQAQAQAASYADLRWWQVFQDPQLQELIRTALEQNYDLQLATERIIAARAACRHAFQSIPADPGQRQFQWWKRRYLPNQLQFSDSHGWISSEGSAAGPRRHAPNSSQQRMRSRR
jgi:hypothetical protein